MLSFRTKLPFITTIASIALAAAASQLHAQDSLTPSGPITNFAVPIYNEEGYRIWYLKGAQGIYVNENQVKIEGLQIRQHAGDDTDAVTSTAHSPAATFRRNDATAFGPGALTVENETFVLTGEDWIWAAKEDRITLNQNVKVTLYDSIGGAAATQPEPTEIESDRLLLERNGNEAKFIFSENVFLNGAALNLDSDQLEIYATRANDQGAIQRILAFGRVHIRQPNRLTTAGRAEVLPAEEKIILSQSPRIEQDGLFIDGGDSLILDQREQRAHFTGSSTNKVEAIGPALANFSENASAPKNENTPTQSTQISSVQAILTRNDKGETQFNFIDNVILNATNLGLQADHLEAYATSFEKSDTLFGKGGAFKSIVATGHVHIAQAERTADADKAQILSNEEKIILTGSPKLKQTDTTVDGGETLIIDRSKGIVQFLGTPENQIHAVTTAMNDLGFTVVPPPAPEEPSDDSAQAEKSPESPKDPKTKTAETAQSETSPAEPEPLPDTTPEAPAPTVIPSNAPPEPTRIDSDQVFITSYPDHSVFQFLGHTAFRATNLALDCDQLDVFATSTSTLAPAEQTYGGIQRILATGNVAINQEQRNATAGKAEVLPLEEKIILSEDPKGQDLASGIEFEGQKITFDRKTGRLLIDPYPTPVAEETAPQAEESAPSANPESNSPEENVEKPSPQDRELRGR